LQENTTRSADQLLKDIKSNIEKVIVGKGEVIDLVLTALLCSGHVLIEDVPGVGKTTLVSALAKSLAAPTPEAAMHIFVAYSVGKFDLFEKLMRSQKREFVEHLLLDMVSRYLRGIVQHKAPEIAVNYADMEVSLCFFSSAIAGVLMQYGGKKELDTEKLASQLCRLLQVSYHDFIAQ